MRDPAAGAVHLARRSRPGDRQVLDQRRERIHRLLEIRGERRPVVHLGVDVDRVLAAPRRREAVVPDPLQVGRLRPWARAGDEQVARVLEVERSERRVAALGERLDTLVDGHRRARRRAEVERHAIEELSIVADVGVTQRVDRLDGGAIERGRDRRGRVAADVVEALVARRRRDEQRDRVGAAHDDGIIGRGSRAAARQHANAPFEAQRAGHRLSVGGRAAAVAVHAAHHEIAVRRRLDGGALRRRQPRLERDPAGTARREVDDDHAIRRAGEHLPRERRPPCRVGHVRRRRGEVQIAAISLDGIDGVERQVQVAERLVRHLRERLRHHALAGQCRRIGVATLAQQPPHVRDRGLGVGIHRVVGTAGPQRGLVELQALVGHPAEDHRAETPVADGQRAHPLRARRAARQRRRRRAIRRRARGTTG